MGPEFNDKCPCRREAEEGGGAERRKTDAKEKGGGSEAGVVHQPSLGCDRPPQTRRGWNRKGSPAKH